jgi:SWIM zinc finger
MPRETLELKAHRMLTEGRLTVAKIRPSGLIVATCKGMSDGEVYSLGFDPTAKSGKGEWRCTCEANAKFHRRCSHLIALQLVTVRPQAAAA